MSLYKVEQWRMPSAIVDLVPIPAHPNALGALLFFCFSLCNSPLWPHSFSLPISPYSFILPALGHISRPVCHSPHTPHTLFVHHFFPHWLMLNMRRLREVELRKNNGTANGGGRKGIRTVGEGDIYDSAIHQSQFFFVCSLPYSKFDAIFFNFFFLKSKFPNFDLTPPPPQIWHRYRC